MNKSEASILFKALGDETRIKIVKMLYHTEEICACKFLDLVDCGQSTLSHHLSILSKCGMLSQRRDGKKILYSCNKDLVDQLMNYIKTKCNCYKGEV